MLNVAIIGTGAISPAHIEAFLKFNDMCRIVALCDIYPEKAVKKAEEYNLNVDIYDDHRKMLERDDIDLVSICTPPYTHAEITINFLNSGKHVLVEKPMASSLEECDKMIEAAKRNNKILSVISQNRFTNPMMKLKKVIESNLAGPILHSQINSYWWRGYNYYNLWWRGTWEKEGGGCTLNHAVHHIDLFKWFTGMPEEVFAVMSNVAHDNAEVEDISVAICRFENGTIGQITSSVVHHGEEQELVFQGKNARISSPWKVRAFKEKENGFPVDNTQLEKEIQEYYEQLPDLPYTGHTGQVRDVLLTILGKQEKVLIDGIQGRETIELITAIYQSASLKEPVKLPLNEKSPFYTTSGIIKNATYFNEKKISIENFEDNNITISGE